MSQIQQAQDMHLYDVSTDDEDYDTSLGETQLSSSVIPQCVTSAMSVDNVVAYLRGKGIPDQFCEIFKGILPDAL